VTAADYPRLGTGGFLTIRTASSAAGTATLQAVVRGAVYQTDEPQPASAVRVSDSTVTVDALGARSATGSSIRVSGTITCASS
jgi:hypothetical protein